MTASQNNTPQGGKHFRVEQPQDSDRRTGMGLMGWLLVAVVVVGVMLGCGMLAHKLLLSAESSDALTSDETPVVAEPAVIEPTIDEQPSGWVVGDDGVIRYYDPVSHAPYLGWLTDETGEHYLCDDGSAAAGWKQIDDNWYYFDGQGALQTGWIDDGSGKRYWVRPEDKTLPHHEWIEIGGVFEPFDDDGAWVNNGEVMPPDDAENVANMTARQQAVIDACDITPWPGRGYCAAWVSDVFVNAGEPAVDGDACDIARAWCTSDDLSELKPGMVIAVTTHERTENGLIWGHVCIYAGNGLVRDSGATSTRWVTLGSWFAWYGTLEAPHWGWANGIPLDEW